MNKYQCPQCGAASSVKVSMTEYHCIYCNSNFPIEVSKSNFGSNFESMSEEARAKLMALRASRNPDTLAAGAKAKKLIALILVGVIVFVAGMLGFVFTMVSKHSTADSLSSSYWGDPTTNKFHVFSGSKGPVLWYILEQSSDHLDSAKFTLRIIDPIQNKTLSESNFIPDMTWSDGFHSGDLIGDFYSYGDTCWNTSVTNGLTARDIYTGKIIADGKQLGTIYPKLSGGISKASFTSYEQKFELTTNDGFDFYFSPLLKQVFSKDDWEKMKDDKSITKTFFQLTDEKRPRLFVSMEKTSANDYSSHIFSSDLENYTPKTNPADLGRGIVSLSQLQPDITFFNGFIVYSDNEKAIVLYQKSIATNSELHVASISKEGKINWDINNKDVEDAFQKTFSQNNRGIENVYSKSALILYYQYGDDEAMALDWNSGKILWHHSDKKKS